jgi:hypothetical protein
MKITRTLVGRKANLPITALLTLTLALAASPSQTRAQASSPDSTWQSQEIPTGRIVWQHVGRVYVNPTNGQFVYAGYLVHLDAIDTSLFNGAPNEGTAYFTFSTGVAQLTPITNNGDVALDLVSDGTFSVYYNAAPSGDWSNPASFSSGKLIATYHRKESLFPQIGPISFHSVSETLLSSSDFTFSGQGYNFDRIAPHGITFAQFFSTSPQATGITDYPAAFAGAGTVFAVGDSSNHH